METLLYVWDQYMIGLDTPGFNNEWLAITVTIMLGLLKEKMRDCNSVSTNEPCHEKPVFGGLDQVRLKPACSNTEAS